MQHKIILLSVFIFLLSIGCQDYVPPRLGDGYIIYVLRGGSRLLTDSNNNVIVHDKVIKYSFDSTYVLAVQKPSTEFYEKPENKNLWLDVNEAKFKKSTYQLYWILNKKQKSISIEKEPGYSNLYGPFDKKSFLLHCKKLSISESLIAALFSAPERY